MTRRREPLRNSEGTTSLAVCSEIHIHLVEMPFRFENRKLNAKAQRRILKFFYGHSFAKARQEPFVLYPLGTKKITKRVRNKQQRLCLQNTNCWIRECLLSGRYWLMTWLGGLAVGLLPKRREVESLALWSRRDKNIVCRVKNWIRKWKAVARWSIRQSRHWRSFASKCEGWKSCATKVTSFKNAPLCGKSDCFGRIKWNEFCVYFILIMDFHSQIEIFACSLITRIE